MVEVTREAKANVIWYCDAPDNRTIGPVSATIMAIDEYSDIPGTDLDDWANNAISIMLDEICEESCNALSPSVVCGYNRIIEIYDIEQTPPTIPPEVMGNVEVILRKINENRDDVEYVNSLTEELDRILDRYRLDRDNIRDLIRSAGVEDIL